MAYEKLNLKTADKLTAAHLAHIESGIESGAAGSGEVSVDTLTGATAVGKSVMTATSQTAARTAIGAGTSSLTLGTTATTALKGDTVIPAAPAVGTAALLTAGTDTANRVWSAKVLKEYIDSKLPAA